MNFLRLLSLLCIYLVPPGIRKLVNLSHELVVELTRLAFVQRKLRNAVFSPRQALFKRIFLRTAFSPAQSFRGLDVLFFEGSDESGVLDFFALGFSQFVRKSVGLLLVFCK